MKPQWENEITFIALISRAPPPHAHGDDIDVPFINMRCWSVHVGTGAMAPPAALIQTPRSPSIVGPRLDLHTNVMTKVWDTNSFRRQKAITVMVNQKLEICSEIKIKMYQVYSRPSGGASTKLWAPAAIAWETYAPTPIILDVVPPGAPTVLNPGPSLPALLMNVIRCLLTTWMWGNKKKWLNNRYTAGLSDATRLPK